jgi:hypothetical protein
VVKKPPKGTRWAEIWRKLAMSERKAVQFSATTVGKKVQHFQSQSNLPETVIYTSELSG